MQYAVIVSEQCPAGMNVKQCFLELFSLNQYAVFEDAPVYLINDNANLYTIKQKHIFAENLDKRINADFFIFATTHASREGVHSLSCHIPGNWGKAELGGKDGELCIAPALMLKKAYLELKKFSEKLDYEVTLEVTHHGPYLEKPTMFIEIGSSQEQWSNKEAGKSIAETIMKLVNREELENQRIAFGIGGPHYCANFNKVLERTDIALGHICPKYALQDLNERIIKKAISKTYEKVELVLLDWKGLGTEKQRIANMLNKLGISYKKTEQVLKQQNSTIGGF